MLIYNPNSGGTDSITPEQLQEALSEAGYEPVYEATESVEDLDGVLARAEGVIVTAGGDGTVHAVGKRLVNKNIPILPLPLGTANNIATALGIKGDPLSLIAGLKKPRRRYFDVGLVHFPWDQEYFLEAIGYGFYADTLVAYEPEQGKSILRGLSALTETLTAQRSYSCPMQLDGQDITGDYVMVEVLNTPSFGPWLKMAPDADLEDGLLEVICIQEKERDNFLNYLTGILNEDIDKLPSVNRYRGQKLEITWNGFAFHLDDEIRPPWLQPPSGEGAPEIEPPVLKTENNLVQVELISQGLEFWLPELDTQEIERT